MTGATPRQLRCEEVHAADRAWRGYSAGASGKFIFFRRAWKRGSERRGSKTNSLCSIVITASRSSAACWRYDSARSVSPKPTHTRANRPLPTCFRLPRRLSSVRIAPASCGCPARPSAQPRNPWTLSVPGASFVACLCAPTASSYLVPCRIGRSGTQQSRGESVAANKGVCPIKARNLNTTALHRTNPR